VHLETVEIGPELRYIRERRLWVWIVPRDPATDAMGTNITTAMSTTRRTLDADAEFEHLRRAILKESP